MDEISSSNHHRATLYRASLVRAPRAIVRVVVVDLKGTTSAEHGVERPRRLARGSRSRHVGRAHKISYLCQTSLDGERRALGFGGHRSRVRVAE